MRAETELRIQAAIAEAQAAALLLRAAFLRLSATMAAAADVFGRFAQAAIDARRAEYAAAGMPYGDSEAGLALWMATAAGEPRGGGEPTGAKGGDDG